jgi:phosphoglycolate phosphatase-like HAD superfamily hydrolase
MGPLENQRPVGHIIFDHDGTLVNTEGRTFVLFEGMKELLSVLKLLGFNLYVWTSRPRKSTLESLKRFELESFFSAIYCSDDGLSKPHPMGLNQLTEGISKKNILHIGDSSTDVDGAKAYGIEVVLACWSGPVQVMNLKEKNQADYLAMNLRQLLEIIKGKFYV